MGLTGHQGILVKPEDVDQVISELQLPNAKIDPFIVDTDSFDLVKEDWWEMHLFLQYLSNNVVNAESIANIIIGKNAVAEGVETPWYYFDLDEVKDIFTSFQRVGDNDLIAATEKLSLNAVESRNIINKFYVIKKLFEKVFSEKLSFFSIFF
jgi:hypothetical protein